MDLLTAVSGTKNGTSFSGAFTYDGSGNPTNYYNLNEPGQWTMSWKNGRELATISNGVVSFNYDYDVNGLRTCVTQGTVLCVDKSGVPCYPKAG